MKNTEKQNLKAKIDQLRKDIWELAKANYGVMNYEIIMEALDADADLIQASLKKMHAKIKNGYVYFPKIVKALKKPFTWRDFWPFKK
jgi:hypothetical protein